MPSLKKILANIDRYTPEQLAQFVADGDCTIYQLNKTGHISPLTKRRIEQFVASGKAETERQAAPQPEPQREPQREQKIPKTEISHDKATAGQAVPPPPPPHFTQPSGEPKTTVINGNPGQSQGQNTMSGNAPYHKPADGYADEPHTPRPRQAGTPPDIPPVPPGGDGFDNGYVIKPVSLFD